MKSPSLDIFYNQIEKDILLAQSYTEVNTLAFIIKVCRLKPYSYIFEEKREKITLHKHWFDEFGNSLRIDNNKKIEIILGDLSLERNKIVCTDLYNGLSMDKVAKISKLAYLLAGKDEDLYQDCFFLAFLGIDNYLRCYAYLYDEWQQIPPLTMGLKNLKTICRNVDVKYFTELKNKENMPIPCTSVKEWISFMPLSAKFLALLEKQYEPVFHILNGK